MEDTDLQPRLPLTTAGVEKFLASSRVEGIGAAYAKALVERFGTDAIRVLATDPERAAEVPGIGEARARKASESLAACTPSAEVVAFLFSCGISDMFIARITGKYRRRTESVLLTDPYSMIEDVWRLSFFTADKIGRALRISADDPRRIRGAIVTAVKHYAEQGHLFATPEEAVEFASGITEADPAEVERQIPGAVESGRIIESMGVLYIPVFYKAEIEGARKLMQLAAYPVKQLGDNDTPLFDRMGHEYSARQREAIRLLLDSPVAVLTGGPGTGKTTVLRGVIEIFEKASLKVVLAAPTGRAAKSMTTLTGVEASTIHRLLGYTPSEGYRHRKIATDVLIIDEGSMMEQVLLDHLLEAVALGTRIIIVGDVDQLPAIGAGDVLRDLINSGAVPVARLDANFRQEEGSRIASGATDINCGRLPVSDEESDFMIIPEPTAQRIHDRILTLMAYELPEKRGIAPTDIRVVTPQQIGLLGARQLNKDLQQRLNPDAPGITRGLTTFRVGDPVMQTANSRERGLYNGDVGIVYNVDEALQTVTVEFPDRRMSVYARSELSELVLAYAMTVHKLQGSEVKYMIFPITMDHKPMLYRNLIYTGVSRATRLCVLVGEIEALQYAIDNNPDSTRHTNFGRRLQEYRQTAGSTASGSLTGAESDASHAPDGAPGK